MMDQTVSSNQENTVSNSGSGFDPSFDHSEVPSPDNLDDWKYLDPDSLKGHAKSPQSLMFAGGQLYLDPDKTGRTHASFFMTGKSQTAERLRKALAPLLGVDIVGWTKVQGSNGPRDTVYWRDASGKEGTGTPPGWFDLYSRALFGRVGEYDGQVVVSFWGRGTDYQNPQAKGPTAAIPDCVRQLSAAGALGPDSIVVWGDGRVCKAGQLTGQDNYDGAGAVDPEVAKRTELARRMHLARGDEKKGIMKQLGVGGGGGKRHEWNGALRKAGLQSPGHSHWRMSSESKERDLERALKGL